MHTIKLGVLGIMNEKKELVAIVKHDETKRSQIFYLTDECGIEDIENLLSTFNTTQTHV